jgi:hypothetical protein
MKYFTIAELSITNTGLPNNPDPVSEKNLIYLVENVLDKVRELYGKPIKVNSGYRSNAVNFAKGGAVNSQHLTGEAADLTGGSKESNKKIFEIIKGLGRFDQLINESDFSWVHVSYKKSNNRKQILKL